MLFTPIKIGNLEIPNRVVVAPMCQYSAVDGVMTDWHTQHLMQLGYSGAGLVMIEATAVERVGRITHHCAGLYNEFCAKSLKEIFEKAKAVARQRSFSSKIAESLNLISLIENYWDITLEIAFCPFNFSLKKTQLFLK